MEWILIRYSVFLLSVYLPCFNINLREELYKLEVSGSGIDKTPKNPVECLGGGGGGASFDWLSTPLLSGEVVKACYTDMYQTLFLILVAKHHMLETDLLQSSVKKYKWALLCVTYLFWSGDRGLL